MSQSLARVLIHLVFSTKAREPVIATGIQSELHAYLVGASRAIDCPPIQIGGTADHVHLLIGMGRQITIADLVKEVKIESSKWMKDHGVPEFSWQSGYGAFSVSESKVKEVIQYIRKQADHHRHRTFQEEYREFLTRR